MAALSTLSVTLHRAWWVMPYLTVLEATCRLTWFEPDLDRVASVVMSGLSLEVDGKRTPLRVS